MKITLISLIFALFISLSNTLRANIYIDPLEKINLELVDKALKSLPARSKTNQDEMLSEMKKAQQEYSLKEGESAYLIYKWITNNIQQDCSSSSKEEDDVYTIGKGLSSGFSSLFNTMAKSLKINSLSVEGYTKGVDYIPGTTPTKKDNQWNAIEIDSIYYLIDSAWGAGSCNGDKFKKEFNKYYFCPPPEQFVRNHLPSEEKYQYLDDPLSIEDFVKTLNLDANFYGYGFKEVNPDEAIISATEKKTVSIFYDPEIGNILVMPHLYLVDKDILTEKNNTCLTVKTKGKIDITCYVNKKGKYQLDIVGGMASLTSFPKIVTYIISSSEDAKTPLYYPRITNKFTVSDMKIGNPKMNNLTKGTKIDFQLNTTTYDNLHLFVGNNNWLHIEMTQTSKGIFEEKEVYIFGDYLAVSTLIDHSYTPLLVYDNQNGTIEASFPQAFVAPKNRLYSPLMLTLTQGEEYFFNITCETCDDISIIDGGVYRHMEKKGSSYTLNKEVSGVDGQLKIAGYDPEKNNYFIYYTYKVK